MASSLYTIGNESANLVMNPTGWITYDSFGGHVNPIIYKLEERKVMWKINIYIC